MPGRRRLFVGHDHRRRRRPHIALPREHGAPDRAFSGLVDIGNGRDVYLECRGIGSPTVVLISGTGNAGDVWREAGSATDPTDPIRQNDGAIFQTAARLDPGVRLRPA